MDDNVQISEQGEPTRECGLALPVFCQFRKLRIA